jgi:hypothetical protein
MPINLDVEPGDEHDHSPAGVGSPDPDVVEPATVARLDQEPALVHRRPPSFGVSYVLTQLSPMS